MKTMKITSVVPIVFDGVPVNVLKFDNGMTGTVASTKCNPDKFPGAVVLKAITLMNGPKFGMATKPHDWTPSIGDTVVIPPHWS